jgi:hypothetical protein
MWEQARLSGRFQWYSPPKGRQHWITHHSAKENDRFTFHMKNPLFCARKLWSCITIFMPIRLPTVERRVFTAYSLQYYFYSRFDEKNQAAAVYIRI